MGVLVTATVTETDWQVFEDGKSYDVRLYQDGTWRFEPDVAAPTPTETPVASQGEQAAPEGEQAAPSDQGAGPTAPPPGG